MPESSATDPMDSATAGSDGDASAEATGCPGHQCLVPDCNKALTKTNDRTQRLKICKEHQVAESVTIDNMECRFCQRCARFHPLLSFDADKRSCRNSLEMHNLRRRRNRAEKGALKGSKEDTIQCLVDNCKEQLDSKKGAHRRYKICAAHQQALSVTYSGVQQRFCQQCSRFHPLNEFDGKKRSCRVRLESHNSRRRRQKSEASGDDTTRDHEEDPPAGLTAADVIEQHCRSSTSGLSSDSSFAGLHDYYAKYFRQAPPAAGISPSELSAPWTGANLRHGRYAGSPAATASQRYYTHGEMADLLSNYWIQSRVFSDRSQDHSLGGRIPAGQSLPQSGLLGMPTWRALSSTEGMSRSLPTGPMDMPRGRLEDTPEDVARAYHYFSQRRPSE